MSKFGTGFRILKSAAKESVILRRRQAVEDHPVLSHLTDSLPSACFILEGPFQAGLGHLILPPQATSFGFPTGTNGLRSDSQRSREVTTNFCHSEVVGNCHCWPWGESSLLTLNPIAASTGWNCFSPTSGSFATEQSLSWTFGIRSDFLPTQNFGPRTKVPNSSG